MKLKLLLFAIIALTITSCSTAYKSGQTPDDVYYSPARFAEDKKEEEDRQDEQDKAQAAEHRRVRQTIRDRRWRDFNDYDYTYNNSPYNYCYCNCNYTGYYYNPYFYSTPIFNTSVIKSTPPRKVNLSSYQGYTPNTTSVVKTNTKYGTTTSSAPRYNNSNKKEGFLNKVSKIFSSSNSSQSNSNTNSSSGSNNTRSYTPSSSSSSSGSSSSGSSGGSISRPSRGGR
jgi:uncharacterized membrane protein YgcG